jgi:hypothetical protein
MATTCHAVTTHVCNACGGAIRFLNRRPTNSDGTSHWDVCKERQFATVKAKGTYYETETEVGYIYKGEKWPTWLRGPVITGSEYQKIACNCEVPPWEACERCTKFFALDVSTDRDSM